MGHSREAVRVAVAILLPALLLCTVTWCSDRAHAEGAAVLASSYGPGFYGSRTAWGHHCAPDDDGPWAVIQDTSLGVASRTLPLGSWVRLWFPDGISIQVPVIDAGPYVDGWTFDLTEPLVRLLGYRDSYHWGVRWVKWEPLPDWGVDCPAAVPA